MYSKKLLLFFSFSLLRLAGRLVRRSVDRSLGRLVGWSVGRSRFTPFTGTSEASVDGTKCLHDSLGSYRDPAIPDLSNESTPFYSVEVLEANPHNANDRDRRD